MFVYWLHAFFFPLHGVMLQFSLETRCARSLPTSGKWSNFALIRISCPNQGEITRGWSIDITSLGYKVHENVGSKRFGHFLKKIWRVYYRWEVKWHFPKIYPFSLIYFLDTGFCFFGHFWSQTTSTNIPYALAPCGVNGFYITRNKIPAWSDVRQRFSP